ncbi:MAG: Tol-Pal system protein TolB, partial [Alphaproteobacteria bacterium]|nr:Tol-Pal system protein TolB [Alphaproteobacteria bacterium]
MLRKLLSFVVACALFMLPAHAVLKVDIVAGAANPISIAVQKFEVAGDVRSKDAAMIREVVEADLKRTGLFRIVN